MWRCFFPLRLCQVGKTAIKTQTHTGGEGGNEPSTPGMGSQEEDAAAAEVVYLHGILEVTVFEAEHLHNAIHGRIMEVNLTERPVQTFSVFSSHTVELDSLRSELRFVLHS